MLENSKDARDLLRLYKLIYRRFVACQMTPAVFAITNVEITAAKGLFKAQGKTLKFDGYRRELPSSGKQEDVLLPHLAERDPLDLLELSPSQHFTEPPPRYNEASLVKTLEKEGIGRPSTYATIIRTIQEREYVEQKERRFYATEKGMKVTDMLVKHFPKVMDLKFTRDMEEELDQIETRKYERNQVLEDFYGPFSHDLKAAEQVMLADAEKCPLCQAPLAGEVRQVRQVLRLLRLSRVQVYQEAQQHGRGGAAKEPPKPTGVNCPNCGKEMVQRMGRRGPFLGCSGYPDCKTTMNLDAEGKPVLSSRPTEHVCDKCGSQMVLREDRAARSWRAAPIPSASSRSTPTPTATRSSRSRPASPARSAAARWCSSAVRAVRSSAVARTPSAAAPSP